MGFYELSKAERVQQVSLIHSHLQADIQEQRTSVMLRYFADPDTYIRKAAYEATGKLYESGKPAFQKALLQCLEDLFLEEDFRVRQTVINAAGEIGKKDFALVQPFFDRGLFDPHHAPRNAVIGSIKKMGEKNPKPVLQWAREYLHHPDKEIRREICHGIELRGRKYPQDILPLLKELQFDKTARVRNTLVHVLGQIAYKKGCLPTVLAALKTWENRELVLQALDEIVDVHERYRNFAAISQEEARRIILQEFQLA